MSIVDARALPADHSDLLHVDEHSIYFRRREVEGKYDLCRYDFEDESITSLTPDGLRDRGPTKPFVRDKMVYCLNETDASGGVSKTALIRFDLRSGRLEVLNEWEYPGDLTLYWMMNDRFAVLIHQDEGKTDAFLYDIETNRQASIKDERFYGVTEAYRELYFFGVKLEKGEYIVCNARLDEFSFYEALEDGIISPEDPIDHSESLLIAPLDLIVDSIFTDVALLPFEVMLRLEGEGDTVQYLGEKEGRLYFSAYIDRKNEETIYAVTDPDELLAVQTLRWSDFEPFDFTYDDVESTIFITNDRSEEHYEVIDVRSGARYLDKEPFERVLEGRYYIHEAIGEDAEPMVSIYDAEQNTRHAFDDAYYVTVDGHIVLLSVNELK
ncbi:Six-bladed beta-propeller, TolB-like protein [Exiguobacterium flavidum]|uniref:Six-bladed beta-propeller, TolB-like protein n=1 Tax=Exiguobacterium flavidum TaxID=2184695 RepID=UPI000DF79B6D|nr:Six-bladed beta-propeller, TolB-like protein [Exiguobacterium flavidum]